MKPSLVAPNKPLSALHYDDQVYPYFYNPWHYHPELELTLVLEGYGQRLVGDSMDNFSVGDLVLVGSKLPHLWKNDSSFYEPGNTKRAQAIVVKFLPDFLGQRFMQLPEFRHIHHVIHHEASSGLKFKHKLKKQVTDLMLEMQGMDDSMRIIQLLKILDQIGKSNDYDSLASAGYTSDISHGDEDDHRKINQTLNYLLKNYHRDITLEEIASHAHMNKNAFCRFFRKKTGKTIMQLLAEIRIGMACRKLQHSEDNIDVICNFVGFNNISNFNRSFKMVIGKTPSQYRRDWMHYSASHLKI